MSAQYNPSANLDESKARRYISTTGNRRVVLLFVTLVMIAGAYTGRTISPVMPVYLWYAIANMCMLTISVEIHVCQIFLQNSNWQSRPVDGLPTMRVPLIKLLVVAGFLYLTPAALPEWQAVYVIVLLVQVWFIFEDWRSISILSVARPPE